MLLRVLCDNGVNVIRAEFERRRYNVMYIPIIILFSFFSRNFPSPIEKLFRQQSSKLYNDNDDDDVINGQPRVKNIPFYVCIIYIYMVGGESTGRGIC